MNEVSPFLTAFCTGVHGLHSSVAVTTTFRVVVRQNLGPVVSTTVVAFSVHIPLYGLLLLKSFGIVDLELSGGYAN